MRSVEVLARPAPCDRRPAASPSGRPPADGPAEESADRGPAGRDQPGEDPAADPATTGGETAGASPRNGADQEFSLLGGRSRIRTIGSIVVALLLAVGVWLLIGQAADFSHLGHAVRRLGPWWLLASVGGAVAGYLGYAVLFQALSSVCGGPRPSLKLSLRLTVVVFGASVIATSAGRLGSEYWSLRKMRERPPQAWSRVLAVNTALWAVLAALGVTGALVLVAGGGHGTPLWLELAWIAALPMCTPPALYLSSPRRRRLAEDRGGKARRTLASALRGLVLLRHAAANRRDGAAMLGGGLILWAGEFLTLWAALRAFGVHLGYGELVVGYATGYISTMLPLPAGGAGGVDAASAYALTLVGVPLGPALLATMVQRMCTYWLPLGVAALGARSAKKLGRDLTAAPRSSGEAA